MPLEIVRKIKSLDFWQLFLLKLVLFYLLFHVLQLYFNESTLGNSVNTLMSNGIARGTVGLMRVFYIPATFVEMGHGAQLFLAQHKSVYIDHSCNAFNILKAFLALVLSTSFRNKNLLWYIPIGVISIFAVNIVRVWALAIIHKNAPDLLEINHKYVFTIVVYAWIFFLFLIWVNKFLKRDNVKA